MVVSGVQVAACLIVVSGVQAATSKQLGVRGMVECSSGNVVVCKWLCGGVCPM